MLGIDTLDRVWGRTAGSDAGFQLRMSSLCLTLLNARVENAGSYIEPAKNLEYRHTYRKDRSHTLNS